MRLNKNVVAFTGGGTGGHIYPGLAVGDALKLAAKESGTVLELLWIGCSKGMDRKIIDNAFSADGTLTADRFYGIPSGKFRRYFSLKNFTDLFRIIGGFFCALHILRKEKPALLFSKGGFVSVPPCLAARLLKIPVFTHECDFTLGLANRINFKSAKTMFVSYEETKKRLGQDFAQRVVVTGNPVRPVFFTASAKRGLSFLSINPSENKKPVLMVLGGSSGARQINSLVSENLDWLCENFTVVHQTGLVNNDSNAETALEKKYGQSYKPYPFIYEQMPDVLAAADIILSRAGANSLWEAAVLKKPMLLVPLCGSGTRGDQVDNAEFFEAAGAARVLVGEDASSQRLRDCLTELLLPEARLALSDNASALCNGKNPARTIAELLIKELEQI